MSEVVHPVLLFLRTTFRVGTNGRWNEADYGKSVLPRRKMQNLRKSLLKAFRFT